jgi:cardiolipin synthase
MDDVYKYWAVGIAVLERLVALGASLHAVLTKRETQSVIGWVGLIWLSPFIGTVLYVCFGINRIRRKGLRIQEEMRRGYVRALRKGGFLEVEPGEQLPFNGQLENAIARITGKRLLGGNSVVPLRGGEQAYPAMLAAIAAAEQSVSLCSYIFDNDRAGRQFVEALAAAKARGVEVRVLVDDVGARYSKPTIIHVLRGAGIIVDTFLPTRTPRMVYYANLRNHRKLMIVDGRVGFTGGMNIREGCCGDWQTAHPVQDLHFRVEGPVVSQMQEVFATDWAFTADERLDDERWFARPERQGDLRARGIADGPDTDLDNIRLTILAALAVAEQHVDIVTPYFLPDDAVISALNVASMRGVKVRIILPSEVNIKPVQWASSDPLAHVLERGCEVFLTPPPFDHTKIMTVDGEWTLIGSSNWDPRSLRLNFEFNVECYDAELASRMRQIVDQKTEKAQRLSLAELRSRSLPTRLRDGIARLAIPYL